MCSLFPKHRPLGEVSLYTKSFIIIIIIVKYTYTCMLRCIISHYNIIVIIDIIIYAAASLSGECVTVLYWSHIKMIGWALILHVYPPLYVYHFIIVGMRPVASLRQSTQLNQKFKLCVGV